MTYVNLIPDILFWANETDTAWMSKVREDYEIKLIRQPFDLPTTRAEAILGSIVTYAAHARNKLRKAREQEELRMMAEVRKCMSEEGIGG